MFTQASSPVGYRLELGGQQFGLNDWLGQTVRIHIADIGYLNIGHCLETTDVSLSAFKPHNADAKFFDVYTTAIEPSPDLRISHIGYDRVLEEKSYLEELEGGRKEPESLRQVIEARKFLESLAYEAGFQAG